MAAEMVKAATSDKLKEMDWAKNIEICELVAQDPGYACHSPPLCSLSPPGFSSFGIIDYRVALQLCWLMPVAMNSILCSLIVTISFECTVN
jgi:hypothetical protein